MENMLEFADFAKRLEGREHRATSWCDASAIFNRRSRRRSKGENMSRLHQVRDLILQKKKYFVVPFIVVLLIAAYLILNFKENPQPFIYRYF
jgi:hypothetical protein